MILYPTDTDGLNQGNLLTFASTLQSAHAAFNVSTSSPGTPVNQ
jgi:hypothetical protein